MLDLYEQQRGQGKAILGVAEMHVSHAFGVAVCEEASQDQPDKWAFYIKGMQSWCWHSKGV